MLGSLDAPLLAACRCGGLGPHQGSPSRLVSFLALPTRLQAFQHLANVCLVMDEGPIVASFTAAQQHDKGLAGLPAPRQPRHESLSADGARGKSTILLYSSGSILSHLEPPFFRYDWQRI